MILGVFLMYISSNEGQLTIENFFMPFGGKLLKTNRWVKLASMMPWEHIEQIYMESFQSERGRPATSPRIAFGAIFIKENDNLTDEGTVEAIAENPYMQYFLGLAAFQAEPLFDPSMMVHTHTCENRIVSLEQPHVRPIQRGKRPNPTEFGQKLHLSVVDGFTFLEQTCWSNFNEGCDLPAVVEDYYRKFGCYPKAVLADKIYQTRANRAYCKEKGIRLTGPVLGRPKTGEADRKQKRQMYKDACDRNAVEGRNGNAKRRFGLDLIAAKLDETAKTEAALILLAMNAAHALVRWLLHFFLESPFWRILWLPGGSIMFFQ